MLKKIMLVTLFTLMFLPIGGCNTFDFSSMPLYNDVYPKVYPDLTGPKRLPRNQPYTTQRTMPPTPQGTLPSMPPMPPQQSGMSAMQGMPVPPPPPPPPADDQSIM